MQTPGNMTSGYSTHNAGVLPVVYFDSDDTAYEMVLMLKPGTVPGTLSTPLAAVRLTAGTQPSDKNDNSIKK